MKKTIFLFSVILSIHFQVFSQSVHQDPTHNFTVQRLLILNNEGEMLMCREKHVWVPLSFVFEDRQYVRESLDSLAMAFGLQIKDIELRGQFSYKYDYHPQATLRNFYVARLVKGEVETPSGMDEVKWLKVDEAIDINTVSSIKLICQQIMGNPNIVWGGSFMVSHVGDDHPTKMVEDFYPLFRRKK